jgi:hypothetical protein
VKHTSIDSGKANLELLENGVIALTWQPNARIEIADMETAMAKVNELCSGLAHPLLVEMTGVSTVTHEARAAFSTECAASRIALLGSTPVDRVIANFRSVDSYPCPTRFFTDRTEALNWLLQSSPY